MLTRREFIKKGGALVAGGIAAFLVGLDAQGAHLERRSED